MKMKIASKSKLAAVILGALLLLIVAAWVIWFGNKVGGFADAMGCANQLVRQVNSPDGTFSAFTFVRKCGATAPDTLQLNIQPSGSEFDSAKYPAFAVFDSKAETLLKWRDGRHLVVKLAGVSRTYRNEGWVGDIQIIYEH